MDRSETQPSGLTETLASDATGLVVHAPGIEIAGQFPESVAEEETLPESPTEPTAVVDFYDAWQAADTETREAFQTYLDGGGVPVFVAATPREFDWLFAEGTLSTNVLGAVSQVVRVRFDPVDDIPAAVDTASAADRTLDSSAVWSAFGSSGEPDPRYVYEGYEMERYESPRFANAVGAYERTLVPRAVKTVPPEADDTDVSGMLSSVGSKIGLAEFWGATKELVTGAGVATGVVAGTAASGPVAPIVGAIGLAAFLRLSDWDDSITDERLLPQAFAPHERAQFETAMQLPPGTIARLRTLGAGELPDSATDDLVDNEEFEAAVERHESELEQIRGLVDGLQGWRRERLIGATDPLEELAARLENEESNVLGEPVSFDEIPYEVQRDAAADGPDDRRAAVTQAVSESELVVLSGPRGTGKTTTAYRAFRELATEYEIRLGRFAYDSASEVKEALEAVPDETLLFLQYRSGEYTVRDDRHLEDVLRFLDDGVCSRVVIETRSEESDELDEAMPTQGSDTRHALWNDRETVEFPRFGTGSASIRTIAEWALDTAGYDGDEAAREETISDVRRLAEGSPEFVKIAARFAAREGRSLAEIDTQDELVWKDVCAGLNTNRDTQERRVLQRLAAFGRVTTAELREMVDRPTEVIDTLEGYLAGSVTDDGVVDPSEELWRLSPSIYRRVLFQRFVFEGEAESRLFDRLLQDAREGPDGLFSGLGGVVSDVFETATESDDEQLCDDVRERAETLVEWADECTDNDEAYYLVVRQLLFAGVPLAADSVGSERLVGGAPRDAAELDIDSPTVLQNLCAYVLSNGLEGGREPTGVTNLGKRIAASSGFNPELFLENVYAMGLANLADEFSPDKARVTDWIDTLDSLAHGAAADFSSEEFLENVYAMALSQLADESSPDDARVADWINTLDTLAHDAAAEFDSELFLANLYAMALKMLAGGFSPDGPHIADWIDTLETLAHNAATDFDPELFLKNVYAMALTNLVNGFSPDDPHIADWIDTLETLAHNAAVDFDPEEFLKNVYAMVLANLADNYSPDDDTIPAWIERINQSNRDTARELDTEVTRFIKESYRFALRQMAEEHTVDSVCPWLTRFEAVLHRDDALATEIRQEYQSFVSVFYQGTLPQQRLEEWSCFFLKLYFRVVDYGVPSLRFRRYARTAPGGALLGYAQYANALHDFNAGRLDHDDLTRESAGFLNMTSGLSNQVAQTAVALVAHELRHVDADLDTTLPAIRQRLRSEHENGQMAGRWRAHCAGEWPTPAIPRYPDTDS